MKNITIIYQAPPTRCPHPLPRDSETPMGAEYKSGSVVRCICGKYFIAKRWYGQLSWEPVRWYDRTARKRIKFFEKTGTTIKDTGRPEERYGERVRGFDPEYDTPGWSFGSGDPG